ncbi:MAG: hypothetical protein E7252_08685 [Lachnospira sp.]|nr:hypothetical protein [Lachnospira sp.]
MIGVSFMKKNLSVLTDDEVTMVFQESVRKAIERNRKAGRPVCGYDSVLKKSYILYPDGRKEYA